MRIRGVGEEVLALQPDGTYPEDEYMEILRFLASNEWRLEALRMATERCDWFMSLDGKVGTLEVGKLADLIVLNRDYFRVPVDDIRTLTSQLTVVDGEIVLADGEFARLDD
jgi:predicted amidohydrolase YtcJ